MLARNGRNVVDNVALTQQPTITQLEQLWRTNPYQIGDVENFGTGESDAAAFTYNGSVLNYLLSDHYR